MSYHSSYRQHVSVMDILGSSLISFFRCNLEVIMRNLAVLVISWDNCRGLLFKSSIYWHEMLLDGFQIVPSS